jgi:S-DNA-T family DNA segregation ATPase FtsK/SpoIIIE
MPAATQNQALRGFALCAASAITGLAVWPQREGNLLGLCGHLIAHTLTATFGWGSILLPWFLLDDALSYFVASRARPRPMAMCLVLSLVCTVLHLTCDAGGRLGALLGVSLLMFLGFGAYVVCIVAVLAIAARWTSRTPAQWLGTWVRTGRQRFVVAWREARARELARRTSPPAVLPGARRAPLATLASTAPRTTDVEAAEAEVVWERAASDLPSQNRLAPPPLRFVRLDARASRTIDAAASPELPATSADLPSAEFPSQREDLQATMLPYRLPPTTVLTARPPNSRVDERKNKRDALLLQEKLTGFGIAGRLAGLTPGPVVTLHEFEPKSGTKLSRIRALASELSMALSAGVRIIAPLPGTGRVGIEVPHADADREIVYLRELLDDERWQQFGGALPLALGKDSKGDPVFCDLARMPHLLVAGATGFGKSVGLNAMLASLLMTKSPTELRLVLIDPKVVEFSGFERIPHLLAPVVTETREAANALRWAVTEMERRYQLLAQAGTKNLAMYNAREGANPLPAIVIVVDELADLMMMAPKQIEPLILRLAQKARAAGIHLVLATQRPSVDVITGVIKANLPSRIAYRVVNRVDSQTILDRGGAEHLLGRGDMLCQLPGELELQRVHGAFISDEEVKALCDYVREQRGPEYDQSISLVAADSHQDDGATAEDDALYDRAVAVVTTAGTCSTSALQRELRLGYNKAAKLVERLERDGVVGPPAARAGGRREVLVQAR